MANKAQLQLQIHRRGWTLVELITTMVIIAIAAIVIVPYASSGNSATGQSVTRLIITDILSAQMDAIANQEYRRIHFFDDGRGWCVEIVESDQLAEAYDPDLAQYVENIIESQGQNQQAIVDFSEDDRFIHISIKDVLFDGLYPSIIFDPTGGIIAPDGSPSTGGSFEVHSGGFAWEIRLAPLTGKIEVVDLGGV